MSRDENEHSLELHHLPRKPHSLAATAQVHQGPTEGNKSLSDMMRRDRYQELFPRLWLSSVLSQEALTVARRLLKRSQSCRSPHDRSEQLILVFSNWFFKVKGAVNLETMTRCTVYSTGPGLRAINLFQVLLQAPSLNFSTSLLSQCPSITQDNNASLVCLSSILTLRITC